MRESPALKIIRLISERGADVSYHDSHVDELPGLGLRSVELDGAVAAADLVVIVTAHSDVDHHAVARSAALTLDLRGVTRGAETSGVVQL